MTNEELARLGELADEVLDKYQKFHSGYYGPMSPEEYNGRDPRGAILAALEKAVEAVQSEYDAFRDKIDASLDRIEPKLNKSLGDVTVIIAQRNALESECAALKVENARLREALSFYSKQENYRLTRLDADHGGMHSALDADQGHDAREALDPTTQAEGPTTPTDDDLALVSDKPAELVAAARILARVLDKPVYLTRMTTMGGVVLGSGTWTITIERDGYGSEVKIEPDGSAWEQDVYT